MAKVTRESFIECIRKGYQSSFVKGLTIENLISLASFVREEIITLISEKGGHLGSSLGTVEITIALHYFLDFSHDVVIWDTGHQSYTHKILTNRLDTMKEKMRCPDGISGFVDPSESVYDHFISGHAGNSLSAAIGYACSFHLKKKKSIICSVIGDGACSTGMFYEALNNIHYLRNIKAPFIIIINDNDMSICPSIGNIHEYLSYLKGLKKRVKSDFFKVFDLKYYGVIDGHSFEEIFSCFEDCLKNTGPCLVHVKTIKGKGCPTGLLGNNRAHSVVCMPNESSVLTRTKNGKTRRKISYSSAVSSFLCTLASEDSLICAITPAMLQGSDLFDFHRQYTERFFDVGICEQHSVTFSSALALSGMKPFLFLYSTFMQRAYDQIIHDVAIAKSPVRFLIDRSGYVGQDGPTHQGLFDTAYLVAIPNFVVMAPSSYYDLISMLSFMNKYDAGPISIRYPKRTVFINKYTSQELILGKGVIIQKGTSPLSVLNYGSLLEDIIRACKALEEEEDIQLTIADARFAKPFDCALLAQLYEESEYLFLVEEGVSNGFIAQALLSLTHLGYELKGKKKRVIPLCFPDNFSTYGTQNDQYRRAHMTEFCIKNCIRSVCL